MGNGPSKEKPTYVDSRTTRLTNNQIKKTKNKRATIPTQEEKAKTKELQLL